MLRALRSRPLQRACMHALQGVQSTPTWTAAPRSLSCQLSRHFCAAAEKSPISMEQLDKEAEKHDVEIPWHLKEVSHETLLIMFGDDGEDAQCEMLLREIMKVDNVGYEAACKKMIEMVTSLRSKDGLITFPYKFGIITAMTSGIVSCPMVFDFNMAMWFNKRYVTMECPPPEDVETWLEVGAWTWNWMEPVLGTGSFVLLAFQFSRAQMENLGVRPYTAWVRNQRASSLVAAYPQYQTRIVREFALAHPFAKK
eukprot:gnl/TRDRNA2_/TRDRNA2_185832_c0_seq1.p1 gnl/TRDRNA2_/TRDRNA2_185832_c0~~gnl/TRDRNA2_/TRDRNA2_185832_c0_seq1.p1  ORF type:complete len:254 (-),score=45.15 gnl/TRDRNA2_/TRDRNA2_185832_c0_seq1:96-857(-)